MREVRCNFCGGDRHQERRIPYLYSHVGKYLAAAVFHVAHAIRTLLNHYIGSRATGCEAGHYLCICLGYMS
jgi:hypothetical protein